MRIGGMNMGQELQNQVSVRTATSKWDSHVRVSVKIEREKSDPG